MVDTAKTKKRLIGLALSLILVSIAFVTIEFQNLLFKLYYPFMNGSIGRAWYGLTASFHIIIFLIISTALLPNVWFYILLAITSASTLVSLIYQSLTNSTITMDVVLWLLSEAGSFLQTFPILWPDYVINLVIILFSILMLVKARANLIVEFKGQQFIFVPLIIWWTQLPNFGHLSKTPTIFNAITSDTNQVRKEPFFLHNEINKQLRNIVLFVDESVVFDEFNRLVQNGSFNVKKSSFSSALSLSNCSAHSHAMIRWGLSQKLINEFTPTELPTIWQYARNAGYKSYLVDGQVTSRPQNFTSFEEQKSIDYFIAYENGLMTDSKIIDLIEELTQLDGKKFIFVTLKGVHYAYESNLPDSYDKSNKSLKEVYRDALLFSKQDFFQKLERKLNLEQTTVIYTSDHGQDLTKRVPHCTSDPLVEQYKVPLLIYSKNSLNLRKKVNYSHSQLFPTLLTFMGYAKEDILKYYDTPLPEATDKLLLFYKWNKLNSNTKTFDML